MTYPHPTRGDVRFDSVCGVPCSERLCNLRVSVKTGIHVYDPDYATAAERKWLLGAAASFDELGLQKPAERAWHAATGDVLTPS
jgi:hypothetical protein